MGKYCDGLLALQQQEEWSHARRGRHEADEEADEAALESDCDDYHRDSEHAG